MCFYVYIFKTEYTNWGGKISEDHIEFFFGLMWYPAVAFFLTFTSCHPMQGTTVHALTQSEGQNMKTIWKQYFTVLLSDFFWAYSCKFIQNTQCPFILYLKIQHLTQHLILSPPRRSPHTPPKEWSECPHYSTDTPNECFFNENHTSIWSPYKVQLRSRDQAILYDESLFNVEDIGGFTDFLLRTRAKLTQHPPCLQNCFILWSMGAFNGKIEDLLSLDIKTG